MHIKRRLDEGHTDIQTWVHWHLDDLGNKLITVENIQDVNPVLERNKQAQRYYSENPQKGEVREVAEIPMLIQHKWLTEEGLDVYSKDPKDVKKLRKKLDSYEYRYLRSDYSFKLETK